jgi:hypothetical protein
LFATLQSFGHAASVVKCYVQPRAERQQIFFRQQRIFPVFIRVSSPDDSGIGLNTSPEGDKIFTLAA